MTLSRIDTKEEAFWWADILVPLVLGIVLYVLLNSEHALPYIVRRLFGPDRITVFGHTLFSTGIFKGLCMYGKDLLWGYALVFALGYWFRDNLSDFRKALVIVGAFEIGMLVWQFATAMGGAFDPGHAIAAFIGNVIGIFVILVHKRAVI